MLTSLIDVRRALESEALVPCFQPIVALCSGRVAGFEVLARWNHPDHGLILPEKFISLAENNGLIGKLTRQILTKTFQSAALFPKPLFLAVNISAIQLRSLSLPRQVRDVAEEYGFPLNRLTVEITESALVSNPQRAGRIANEFRSMGCKLALDDFGTGYSSLAHLQALPFSKLKVDRSFVQDMTCQPRSRKIVAAVVGLGHSLDMVTVAEGVETQEQADMLLGLGCELAQGWLYGRPMPAESIPDWIASVGHPVSTRTPVENNNVATCSLDARPAQRLAQLQAIYDGAPVGLCFLDKNLRYISLNQRLAEMNGAPVSAHVGRTVHEMVPKLFPILEPYLRRALNGEVIPKIEAPRPATRPGESDRTTLLSYQPAFDEAREVVGISIAVLDVTTL